MSPTNSSVENKIGERIRSAGLHLKRVSVIVAQVIFECVYRIVPVCGATLPKYVAGEIVDPRIEIRRQHHIPRRIDPVFKMIRSKNVRGRFGRVREYFVSNSLLIMRPSLNGAFRIDSHERQLTLDRNHPRGAKQNRCIDGLQNKSLFGQATYVFSCAEFKESAFAIFSFESLSRA